MTMSAGEILDRVEAEGGRLQAGADGSLICERVNPALKPELIRLQDVIVAILLGKCSGPVWPALPSKDSCVTCRHPKSSHCSKETWHCGECDCDLWRKKLRSDPPICKNCGHGELEHFKRATSHLIAGFRLFYCHTRHCNEPRCGCTDYRKPRKPVTAVKVEQLSLLPENTDGQLNA